MFSDLLTLCCLVALDVAWLTPWLFVLNAGQSTGPLVPWLVLVSVELVGTLLAWAVARREATVQSMRVAVLVAGIVVAFVVSGTATAERLTWPDSLAIEAISVFQQGVGPALLAMIVTLGVWWRATVIGGTRAGDRGVAGRTATGLAALAVAALLSLAGIPTGPPWILYAAMLVFLFAAVLASSLEGLEYVRSSAKASSSSGFGRGWIILSLGLAVAVLIVGLLATSLVERQGLAVVVMAFRALLIVIEVAILAMALPAGLLIDLLSRLIHAPAGRAPVQPPSGLGRSPLPTPGPNVSPVHVPPWLVQAGGGIAVALIIALVIVGLIASLRRIAPPRVEGDAPEEHSSVWSWRLVRDALHRLASRRQGGQADDQVDGVRLAYRGFLAFMAEIHHGRHTTETPADFEQRLGDEVKSLDEVDQLTRRYEAARYGMPQPSATDSTDAQELCRRIASRLDKSSASPIKRQSGR